MMKKWICIVLAAALLTAAFAGCRARTDSPAAPNTTQAKPEDASEPETSGMAPVIVQPDAAPLGFTAFDSNLIAFLRENGKAEENFSVSPLSFKAALALAAEGAEGETLNQLLAVLGFSSVAELEAWYQTVLAGVDEFESAFNSPWMENDSDSAYRVVNAIWRNESLPGAFLPDYVNAVSQSLRAEADSAPAAELTQAVNDWVNEQTNGLIPKLLNNAADSNAILVNALYLKSGWLEPFQTKGAGDFTAVDGTVVQKEYMEHTDSYLYYEDEGCQLVSIPLVGGVSMIFVLGDADNLPQKLSQAYYTKVHVTVPTFDLETSFENGELVSFLRALGCDRMFGSKAEFGKMFTDALYVDDIIQKTKVHIYEEGLEAAAATGMVMKNTSMPNPDQPKEFCADHGFSFCIVQGSENPELLFWGQIVK